MLFWLWACGQRAGVVHHVHSDAVRSHRRWQGSTFTHGRLIALGLTGMAKALDEQQRQPDLAALTFEKRFALLVDGEATERDNKRMITRLRFASLRQNVVVEDIDMRAD